MPSEVKLPLGRLNGVVVDTLALDRDTVVPPVLAVLATEQRGRTVLTAKEAPVDADMGKGILLAVGNDVPITDAPARHAGRAPSPVRLMEVTMLEDLLLSRLGWPPPWLEGVDFLWRRCAKRLVIRPLFPFNRGHVGKGLCHFAQHQGLS